MDITATNMKSGQNPVIKPEQGIRNQRKLEMTGKNVPLVSTVESQTIL